MYTPETHGPKWHAMNCGGRYITRPHWPKRRSMRSERIAEHERVDVDTVRRVLREYRQRKWGNHA